VSGAGRARWSQRLDDLVAGCTLLARVPAFLRRPIRPNDAREIVQRRLARREADFLALVRREVFGLARDPYRALLRHAGCEFGDLERLTQTEGVEGALGALARHGVYVTLDEFKGRAPVRRGALTVPMAATDALTRMARGVLGQRTSGSRGTPSSVPMSLAFEADHAVNACLFLAARGNDGWMHALWEVPGGAALRHALWLSRLGQPPTRWFSQADPRGRALPARYAWSLRLARLSAATGGVRLPPARFVSVDEPAEIVDWMARALAAGRVPHVWTFVTSAVRVCQAAEAAGIRLDGAQFTANGEPITAGRIAAIERVGARLGGYYGSVETGPLGYACLAPSQPDEMHLLCDLHAVVNVTGTATDGNLPSDTMLVSSLRPTAPLFLLNVAFGDCGVTLVRRCGCPLESLGWIPRRHAIRSYSRVTVGGMTFFDSDLIGVLEDMLPARFGGGPTDYQLIEEATPDGRSALRLVIAPSVGSVDPAAVEEAFLDGISGRSDAARVMGMAWRRAGVVRIERRLPTVAASGKIAHFRTIAR
jgi:hypothetical protein